VRPLTSSFGMARTVMRGIHLCAVCCETLQCLLAPPITIYSRVLRHHMTIRLMDVSGFIATQGRPHIEKAA